MSIWTTLGRAITAHQERLTRSDEIARLQALSDDQLAARGLSRDRIVHHVYRDIVGI